MMNFMIHWLCISLITVMFLFFTISTLLTKIGQSDCNTKFSSSSLSKNADSEPAAFNSYMIKCSKHPYNLYTVLTCTNHVLDLHLFFFNLILYFYTFHYQIPPPFPCNKNQKQNQASFTLLQFLETWQRVLLDILSLSGIPKKKKNTENKYTLYVL